MDLINRKRVLQQMRRRDTKGKLIPFSCVVCTYNKALKTGGERLTISKAVVYSQKHVAKSRLTDRTRLPNHEANGTLNVMLLPSREIRTIHVRLIEKFNGMIVYD